MAKLSRIFWTLWWEFVNVCQCITSSPKSNKINILVCVSFSVNMLPTAIYLLPSLMSGAIFQQTPSSPMPLKFYCSCVLSPLSSDVVFMFIAFDIRRVETEFLSLFNELCVPHGKLFPLEGSRAIIWHTCEDTENLFDAKKRLIQTSVCNLKTSKQTNNSNVTRSNQGRELYDCLLHILNMNFLTWFIKPYQSDFLIGKALE